MRRARCFLWIGVALVTLCFRPIGIGAQELAPRAYWPAPNGTKVVVFAYQYSSGDVVMDPSLPITGVDSRIHVAQLSYQQTFDLLGRTATIQIDLPYSEGTTEGVVQGEFRRRSVSTFADARVRLAVNFLGAPTMDRAGFQQLRAAPRTIVGASIVVQPPTGGYEPDKLINVGTNRWGVKPGVGLIWPLYPTWLVELDAGVWFFGDNDQFLGTTRGQEPILAAEAHLIKRIRPGFWVAFDVNYYTGGRTAIGGDLSADLQRNARIGGTLTFPLKRRHALRVSYSTGVVTASGGDFNVVSVSYAYVLR